MRKLFTLFALALAVAAAGHAGVAEAQVDDDLARPPPIPEESADYRPLTPETDTEGDVPIPPKIQEEQIEPTVRIIDEEDRRIEEYSRNGQVYMVKVTPAKGPAYYYIDTNGDGKLELDPDQQALNPVQPVYWKIKEWD
ncbi:MAG: DUF2782 domain-containing protein [Xanthomonadales bacterium]|nr:DUF2782 domain-containing protein [Gammaproteobacteria bacterium]MBT8050199.1 DUF2782 domain-containing protein [Gammaproteobacteria bacterium]NNJ77890.1 DUF2782 domain-containing protein [Xanthomonadales bacterium]NNL04103.1 DUF2782 domain-containing protein [Xanthomonadales bacterium]